MGTGTVSNFKREQDRKHRTQRQNETTEIVHFFKPFYTRIIVFLKMAKHNRIISKLLKVLGNFEDSIPAILESVK